MMLIEPAQPSQVDTVAPLLYPSVHELMDFMFANQAVAEDVLSALFAKSRGHFSHRFATVAMHEERVVGVELGYDRSQLAAQELAGSVAMLLASPPGRWWHLAVRTGSALKGYIQPPSDGAYYINNLAVSPDCRGQGIGQQLLADCIRRAQAEGYAMLELDVTRPNVAAIAFYQKQGFEVTGESGGGAHEQRTGLPPLVRMQRALS